VPRRPVGPPQGNGRPQGGPLQPPRRPDARPPGPPPRPVLRDDPLAADETDVIDEVVTDEVADDEDEPEPEPRRRPRRPDEQAADRTGGRGPERATERPADRPSTRGRGSARDAEAETSAVPGRHRRRAGESPDGRPVSSFSDEKAGPKGSKPKSGRRRRTSFWKELPLLILVALLLTFLIQTFLAKVYVIPSGSMETTLHGCTGCNNDRVLVDKITYRFSDPEPGDVVVFRGPDSWGTEQVTVPSSAFVRGLQQVGSLIGLAPPDEKDFVKRVIATGGQTVSCCDSRNRVMVNGKPLDEPYIYYLPEAGPARQVPFGPVTVPDGELWMMGDSRNNSSDSRATGHGPVPVANVIGKARLKVLPINRFGWISSPDPQSPEPVGMGAGGGAPLALGLVGTLPLAAGRRWRNRLADELDEFLPSPRRRRRLRRR